MRWDIHIHDSWGPHFRAPGTWRLRWWQSAFHQVNHYFGAKVMEKISQFIVRDQKQKTNLTHWNLDPMKLPNQDVILDRLEKASPRWIWCSFLNFNEPNMEGENETSLKVCSVFFHTYKLRTRPDSSKSRIFDMSQRSSVLKLQNQLKWKPQLRVCVPGSINSLYWR